MKLVGLLLIVAVALTTGCRPFIDSIPVPPAAPQATASLEEDIVYVSYGTEVRAYSIDRSSGRLNQFDSVTTLEHSKLFVLRSRSTLLLAAIDFIAPTITFYSVGLRPDGRFASGPIMVQQSPGFDVQFSREDDLLFVMNRHLIFKDQDTVRFTPEVTTYKVASQSPLSFAQTSQSRLEGTEYEIGSGYRWTRLLWFAQTDRFGSSSVLWMRRHQQSGSLSATRGHLQFLFDPGNGALIRRVGDVLTETNAVMQHNGSILALRSWDANSRDTWLTYYRSPSRTDAAWYCATFDQSYDTGYKASGATGYVLPACWGKGFFSDPASSRFYILGDYGRSYSSYVFSAEGIDVKSGVQSAMSDFAPERVAYVASSSVTIGYTRGYPSQQFFSLKVHNGTVTVATAPIDTGKSALDFALR